MSRTLSALVVVIALVAAACTDDASVASETPTTPGEPEEHGGFNPLVVDTSKHSVPLEDIHFDTFDGGSVTLADSDFELRQRLLDAIPPIDNPTYGTAADGDWLDPDDLVLGYVSGEGEEATAHAYPFKILNFHEIVNDVIDGRPVLISYCPLCRSAIVFDRTVDGRVLAFSNTSALYESDMVMIDRSTGSYWWQVAGKAIVGPLTDVALEPLPASVDTWAGWVAAYPDTKLLTRETGFSRPYERDVFAGYAERINNGQFAFPVGETAAGDRRLAAAELVVGVELGGEVRAYPVAALDGELRDEVGGIPVVVIPRDGGADVFTLTDGGDLAEQLPTRTTFWFAFVGAFPDTTVGGG